MCSTSYRICCLMVQRVLGWAFAKGHLLSLDGMEAKRWPCGAGQWLKPSFLLAGNSHQNPSFACRGVDSVEGILRKDLSAHFSPCLFHSRDYWLPVSGIGLRIPTHRRIRTWKLGLGCRRNWTLWDGGTCQWPWPVQGPTRSWRALGKSQSCFLHPNW